VKWILIGLRFPARSSSSPASVCGPSAKAVEYVTVVPTITGPGAGAPSIVAFWIAPMSSDATRESESAEATSPPSAGVEDATVGAVLSTRRSMTGAEAVVFPAASATTTRRS
jgi:hypothetical protein